MRLRASVQHESQAAVAVMSDNATPHTLLNWPDLARRVLSTCDEAGLQVPSYEARHSGRAGGAGLTWEVGPSLARRFREEGAKLLEQANTGWPCCVAAASLQQATSNGGLRALAACRRGGHSPCQPEPSHSVTGA